MSTSEILNMLVIYTGIVICCLGIYKIFHKPLNFIIRNIFKMFIAGIIIWILNMLLIQNNIHIGINLITCLIVSILGIPGAILLCFI